MKKAKTNGKEPAFLTNKETQITKQTDEIELLSPLRSSTPVKEFSTGFKSTPGGRDDHKKDFLLLDEKEDMLLHLNRNLILLEREAAFFNFALQEITDLVG